MGSIFKKRHRLKGGEVVEGRTWWIRYFDHGRPIYENTRCVKKTDAERLLKQREGEIAEGRIPGFSFERVRFEDLVRDLVTDYEINAKRSLPRVKRGLRHLAAFFGGWRATEITTDRIRAYTAMRLEEGATNATINRELAALKRMFNLAARCTPPKVGFVPYIPMLKENNVRKGFLTHDQFLALRDALPSYLKGLVTFAYYTGWRRGEIVGLTWDRVDLKEGLVRLEPGETKNDQARTVYLVPELLEVLRKQLAARRLGCPFVFHLGGKPVGDFRKSWEQACAQAGVPKLLFHDLRRTAIRNLVRAGVPERVAMMISGHKTRTVFDRYNIVSAEDLKQAAHRQEAYVQGQSAGGTVTNFVTNPGCGGIGRRKRQGQAVEITGAWGGDRTRTGHSPKGF